MSKQYYKVMKDRVPADQIGDPAARKLAMKPEVDWYNAEVCTYVDENPTGKRSVKFAVSSH